MLSVVESWPAGLCAGLLSGCATSAPGSVHEPRGSRRSRADPDRGHCGVAPKHQPSAPDARRRRGAAEQSRTPMVAACPASSPRSPASVALAPRSWSLRSPGRYPARRRRGGTPPPNDGLRSARRQACRSDLVQSRIRSRIDSVAAKFARTAPKSAAEACLPALRRFTISSTDFETASSSAEMSLRSPMRLRLR